MTVTAQCPQRCTSCLHHWLTTPAASGRMLRTRSSTSCTWPVLGCHCRSAGSGSSASSCTCCRMYLITTSLGSWRPRCCRSAYDTNKQRATAWSEEEREHMPKTTDWLVLAYMGYSSMLEPPLPFGPARRTNVCGHRPCCSPKRTNVHTARHSPAHLASELSLYAVTQL